MSSFIKRRPRFGLGSPRGNPPTRSMAGHRFARPSRSPCHDQPESSGYTGELDEGVVALEHLETSSLKLLVDDLNRDVVLRGLLLARQPPTTVVHGFYDDKAPPRLKRSSNEPEHRLVLGHLVIRVVDQHGIELTRGKMWIVSGTNAGVNITD